MIYAISDLHGSFRKYKKMLEKINFSDEDTLYVLGDCIDRGENGGIDILLDMMERKNVIPLCGNHEYSAIGYLKTVSNGEQLDTEDYEFNLWVLCNGGEKTLKSFIDLPREKMNKIIEYIGGFMLYDEVKVGGNKFFLSHTVPEKKYMDDFENLDLEYLLFPYPEYDKVYFDDKYIVTGHLPTIYTDPKGNIIKKNNHIAIDCGAVFGKPLGCICLDTLEEFYVTEDDIR